MFGSGPSPAVAYQLSLKLVSLLRLLLERVSAHRGTGVAIVLPLTRTRASSADRSHARGLTGLSVWRAVPYGLRCVLEDGVF